MSCKISFWYKNGFGLLLLLGAFVLSSGFVLSENPNDSDRKLRKKIVKTAYKYIGTKYRAGGKSPKGFDCSGFTSYVMKENNILLGASSKDQSLQGEAVKISKVKPGDLVYFSHNQRINHVGIVTKVSRKSIFMTHASSSRGIIEEDIYQSEYWEKRLEGARSVIP